MKHRSHLVALAAVLGALAFPTVGLAQDREDDRYDDDERNRRFALALGAGIVEPDGGGEIYYHAGFRFRVSGDDERGEDDWRYAGGRGDIEAHIEPEVGYWERDEAGASESDLSVGINAIGVVPGRAVDYFFGVGLGLHFLDTQIEAAPELDESDSHVGGNFQVGLDVHISPGLSLFGTGRFDVIEGLDETLQGKVYMGLRFRF